MKMYKIELYVIDFEDIGVDNTKSIIENEKYISSKVISIQVADIGRWHDSHPLNLLSSGPEEYRKYF